MDNRSAVQRIEDLERQLANARASVAALTFEVGYMREKCWKYDQLQKLLKELLGLAIVIPERITSTAAGAGASGASEPS